MTPQERVLAVSNGYLQKFYWNPDYQYLPKPVQQEIREMAIRFTEEAGGILEISFREDGNLQLITHVDKDDFGFDEIGAELLMKEFQREKEELFAQLELWYQTRLQK